MGWENLIIDLTKMVISKQLYLFNISICVKNTKINL